VKIFVPPLKCQGIKTKLVDWILEQVELDDKTRWVEPFMGSGVVGFNVRPRQAIFSDINPHIITFYNAIKSGEVTPRQAKLFLEGEGKHLSENGQEYYYQVRDRFNQNGDPFDFLFLSRASFNGVMRFNQQGRYNVPFGHKPQRFSKAYITKIVNQIDYVSKAIKQYAWEFICADFRAIISHANSTDFIYADPPYAGRHTDYFNSWPEQAERNLYELLLDTPAKFILSTWHSNCYRTNTMLEKYAHDFTILTREHFYHVGASEKNRNPMLEAIVLNYHASSRPQSPAPSLPYESIESGMSLQLRLFERSQAEIPQVSPHP
jgi:DNA adenine methylase